MKILPKAFLCVIATRSAMMSSTLSVKSVTGLERHENIPAFAASLSAVSDHLASKHIHNRINTRNHNRNYIRGSTHFLLRRTNTNGKPNKPTLSDLHRYRQLNVVYPQWEAIGDIIAGQAASEKSGESIAISNDGSIIAIGAHLTIGDSSYDSGQVKVYQLNEEKRWKLFGTEINGESNERFGWSIDMSANGQRLVVGAHGASSSRGIVRVFEMAGDWGQIGYDLVGKNELDRFGFSVSMSGDGYTIAVGAIANDDNGSSSGSVQIIRDDSGSWETTHQLVGDDAFDLFGHHISLSADASALVIGAPGTDLGNRPGYIKYVEFDKRSDGTMDMVQPAIKLNGHPDGDRFGYMVSLSNDGKNIAVSGYKNTVIKIFNRSESTFKQLGQDIVVSDSLASTSLSNDGKRIVVGDPLHDDLGENAGLVQVYDLIDEQWEQTGDRFCALNDGTCKRAGDQFGYSVAISADGLTVAAGALYSDLNGKGNSGHVRAFSSVQAPTSSPSPSSMPTKPISPTLDPITPEAPKSSSTLLIIALICGAFVIILLAIVAFVVRRNQISCNLLSFCRRKMNSHSSSSKAPSLNMDEVTNDNPSTHSITNAVISDNPSFLYDVFLSHNWGLDGNGRDNHERVMIFCEALKKIGLRPWVDNEQMRGDLLNRMARGIESSSKVIVFVTNKYVEKVKKKSNDNCKFEFEHALNVRKVENMIPVVMEDVPSPWEGPVGLALGSYLYYSFKRDDELDQCVSNIQTQILKQQGGSTVAGGKANNVEQFHGNPKV